MQFTRAFVTFAICLSSLSSFAGEVPRSVDEYLKGVVAAKHTPGISVAVCENGKLVFAKGYGFADLQNSVPATAKTVYRIGSVTKQFTATMIMQMEREGKLSLDDAASKFVEALPEAWQKVTIRQLLTHTSGIPSYTNQPKFLADHSRNPTKPMGILDTVAKLPMDFDPGTKWSYNNSGYVLLGMVIEKLDKRLFGESLKARITAPLGMSHTYFTGENVVIPNRAQGYQWGPGGYANCLYLSMDWPFAAGSMESTVEDLAKWDAALYTEKILPKASLQQMWTACKLPSGTDTKYGFGWSVDTRDGINYVEHGGGINGFTCKIMRVMSKGLTVIVLTNSEMSNPSENATAVAELIDPSLKRKPAEAIKDENLAMTAQAREMFANVLAGKLDRSKLSPECSAAISEEMLHQVHTQLGSLGELNAFELLSSTKSNSPLTRAYRAKIGAHEFKVTLSTDDKGLITDFNIGG